MAEESGKPPDDQWRPTFGDMVTVAALVAAIIMWFAQPNWQIGISVIIVSIALVAFTALRHNSHPIIRGAVAALVVALLIAVAWSPIWNSFHKDYPRVTLHWPISFGDSGPRILPRDRPELPSSPAPAITPPVSEPKRTILSMTPDDLLKLSKSGEDKILPYLHSWIRIKARFKSIFPPDPQLQAAEPHIVDNSVAVETYNDSKFGTVILIFDEKWREDVLLLKDKDSIKALCQLMLIKLSRLVGIRCELEK